MRVVSSTAILLSLALALGIWGGLVHRVTGFKPLRPIDAKSLDQPPEVDDRDAPRFLAGRNRVAVVVPRDMPAGEFLRLLQFDDYSHVRDEIAKKEGLARLEDGTMLRKGTTYEISLTPPVPEREVP